MLGRPLSAPALDASLLSLVDREARALSRLIPRGAVPLDDLIGYGRLGLVEAQRRFVAQHGVPFELFARYRIRGAIFDGLRETGFTGRRTYARLRREALAHEALGEPIGEPPGGATPANDAQRLFGAITELATLYLVDAALSPAEAVDPSEAAERRLDGQRVVAALGMLTEAEREVLMAAFDLDDTGDSAASLARRLGISRSAVARRQRKALTRMRSLMTRRGTLPVPRPMEPP